MQSSLETVDYVKMSQLDPAFDPSHAVYALGRMSSDNKIQLLGTAFGVSTSLLCTAAHVTGGADGLVIVVEPKVPMNGYQSESPTEFKLANVDIVAIDPTRDICFLRLQGSGLGSFNFILGSDSVRPGDALTSFGFPHADSGRLVLTRRDVTCSAKVLGSATGVPLKQLVMNVFARPGESGGPVLDSSGRLVAFVKGAYAPGAGMISIGGIDPAALHATTHAISAEYVQEILNDLV